MHILTSYVRSDSDFPLCKRQQEPSLKMRKMFDLAKRFTQCNSEKFETIYIYLTRNNWLNRNMKQAYNGTTTNIKYTVTI